MSRFAARVLVPMVLVMACADDGRSPTASGTPPPPATSGGAMTSSVATDATSRGSSSSGSGTENDPGTAVCASCAAGEFCVAEHQAGVTDAEALQYECRAGQGACVAAGDASLWCGNDDACCEGGCDEYGRCGVSVSDTGGTTDLTTSGTGTTGTGTTGTGTTGTGTTGTGTTGG